MVRKFDSMFATIRRLAVLVMLAASLPAGFCLPAHAQMEADVPYVPTPWKVVDTMLGMAKIGSSDFIVDLGSGDGRIVVTAAKRHGIRGFGVDLDSSLVNNARREAERQGVAGRVRFLAQNIFITDISEASVVTMYLLPKVNLQMRQRLFSQLKPGARVVSHDFDMGNWKPDERVTIAVPEKSYGPPSSEVFLWVIPANASGRWQWQMTSEGRTLDCILTLDQTFQLLSGTAQVGGLPAEIIEARVRGTRIAVALQAEIDGRRQRIEFDGQLDGDRATGGIRMAGRADAHWSAMRVTRGTMQIDAGVVNDQSILAHLGEAGADPLP